MSVLRCRMFVAFTSGKRQGHGGQAESERSDFRGKALYKGLVFMGNDLCRGQIQESHDKEGGKAGRGLMGGGLRPYLREHEGSQARGDHVLRVKPVHK